MYVYNKAPVKKSTYYSIFWNNASILPIENAILYQLQSL